MSMEAGLADDDRTIPYRITLDRSDVWQAVSDVETAATRIANSLSGLSTNMVSNAFAANLPGAPPAMGTALNPAMGAMWLAQQQAMAGMPMAMSPMAALAQDAFQQQALLAGPSPMGGFGPSFTKPFGGAPVIDPFRPTMSTPYNVNMGYLQQFGPTGAPGDPRRSRLIFGMGEGSVFDQLRVAAQMAVFGRTPNDNLEDSMYRQMERRRDYFGQNLAGLARFGMFDLGIGAVGGLLGGAAGMALGGPVGSAALGFAGSMVGGVVNQTIGALARPYERMSNEFANYVAPFVRESRLGGGIDTRERMGVMRDMARIVGSDSFFTSREYQELVRIGGETGMFRFTGQTSQALQGIKNLREAVVTLFKIGVPAREHLQTIDTMINQIGISPFNPQMFANTMGQLTIAAQSAGMSTSQMVQASAPAGQMFASQGMGLAQGQMIHARHLAIGGELQRRGVLAPADMAYFGGNEGLATALTGATAAGFRTPFGQTYLANLFAPGGANMLAAMQGQAIPFSQVISGASTLAQNPMRLRTLQALMPRLLHNTPGLQESFDETALQNFRDMFPGSVGPDGKANLEHFMAFQAVTQGWTDQQLNAQYSRVAGGGEAAAGIRRSIADEVGKRSMETRRGPSIPRRFQKFLDRTVRQGAVGFWADISDWGLDRADDVENFLYGTYRYKPGAVADLARGGGETHIARANRIMEGLGTVGTAYGGPADPMAADWDTGRRLAIKDAVGRHDVQEQFLQLAQSQGGMTAAQAQGTLANMLAGAGTGPQAEAILNRVTALPTTLNTALSQVTADFRNRNSAFREDLDRAIASDTTLRTNADRDVARRITRNQLSEAQAAALDPDMVRRAQTVVGMVTTKKRQSQQVHVRALEALRSYRDNDDPSARALGRAGLRRLDGRESEFWAIDDEDARYDAFSQAIHGKRYADLDDREQRQVGYAMAASGEGQASPFDRDPLGTAAIDVSLVASATLAGAMFGGLPGAAVGFVGSSVGVLGASLGQRAFSGRESRAGRFYRQGDQRFLDERMLGLEQTNKRLETQAREMGGKLGDAAKYGSGGEQVANAGMLKRMTLAQLAMASGGDRGRFDALLAQAGLSKDDDLKAILNESGLNTTNFDRGVVDSYFKDVESRIGQFGGMQSDVLWGAWEDLSTRKPEDLAKNFGRFVTRERDLDRIREGGSPLSEDERRRVRDAFGLGAWDLRGGKAQALGSALEGTGADVDKTMAMLMLLEQDNEAALKLGLSGGLVRSLRRVGSSLSGGQLDTESLVPVFRQMGYDAEGAQEVAQDYVNRQADGSLDKEELKAKFLQAAGGILRGGYVGESLGGGTFAGQGILGAAAGSGLTASEQEQARFAQALENFTNKFSQAEFPKLSGEIAQLQEVIGRKDGATGLAGAIQKLDNTLTPLAKAAEGGMMNVRLKDIETNDKLKIET